MDVMFFSSYILFIAAIDPAISYWHLEKLWQLEGDICRIYNTETVKGCTLLYHFGGLVSFWKEAVPLRGRLPHTRQPPANPQHSTPLNAVKLALTLFRAICILTVAVMYLAYRRWPCPILSYYVTALHKERRRKQISSCRWNRSNDSFTLRQCFRD